MILTGSKIEEMRTQGHITIEPFEPSHINPNSYNYRLGPLLAVPSLGSNGDTTFTQIEIPEMGYVINAGQMYLGHTLEVLGSSKFAMSLIGRSSLGRLGLFLQLSADLGHTGSSHQWTLELMAAKPFKLYPGMRIGQISFWLNDSPPSLYQRGYARFDAPTTSKYQQLVGKGSDTFR